MIRQILLAAVSTIVLVNPVLAAFELHYVSDSAIDCDHPAVAQGPDFHTIVAWQDAGGQVWTEIVPPVIPAHVVRRELVNHGPGTSPRVAYTWFGFVLVWIDGSRIYYRYAGNNEFIEPANHVDTGLDLSDAVLDVWGIASPGYNVAWVVFEVPGEGDAQRVMMLRLTKGPPQGPEMLAENTWYPAFPQVTALPGWPEPLARVYYVRDDFTLGYRSEVSYDIWHPEMVVPFEIFGIEFDAATGPLGIQSVLSLGLPPTCPCNEIHATRQDADGVWLAPEELTVPYGAYNWPRSPSVRVDSQGRTHAFWTQCNTGEEFEPLGRTLEYWVRDEVGWADHGNILATSEAPGLGDYVAMDVSDRDHPAFAWTVIDTVAGVPQPRQVVMGRISLLVGVDDAPSPLATLEAWPNPFNPSLTVTGAVPAGASSVLAVHDLAGRRVRSLGVEVGQDGRFTATWDGRDDADRALPSGVYVLRLAAGTTAVSRRVVLAR